MNNYKYNTSDLYEATNGGLDILEKHFPDCVGGKKFKFRATEKSASASITQQEGGKWILRDFGSGKTYDAVSAVMEKLGLDFMTTIKQLYNDYGLASNPIVFTANIEFKENKENLPADFFKINIKDTYHNLASFGKFITPTIATNYNVYEVASYQNITKKEGKLMVTTATENYPIFCYSNDVAKWAKTYKPAEFKRKNNKGKTVNFKHGYLGVKDNDYIHGLDHILNNVDEEAIIALYEELSRTKGKNAREDLYDEIKELQVKNIIICSGGSDGLNVASISDEYYPIWFNSEGQQISYAQYQRISKLCQNFYNLPDIDNSGKKYAYTLANKYWNLKTIWLPAHKMGEKGKDFRDWLKYYTNADKTTIKRQFDNLLRVALKCNFIDKNDKGRPMINVSNFHYFLNANNYFSYKLDVSYQDKSNEDTSFLVKLDDYKVSIPETAEIRRFCVNYLKDKGADLSKINLIKSSRAFSVNELKNIDTTPLDFTNYNSNTQFFYFKNGIVAVTDKGVEFSTQNIENKHVWQHKVVGKIFKKQSSYFEYYKDEAGNNRVKFTENNCDFMNYIINGSRVFWRKEIEESYPTITQQEKYRAKNLFTLTGANLTEKEHATQEAHFLNKCFAIGYLLHNYKREDFAKFIYIMDDTVKESDDDANGGTGKSLLIRGLKEILNIFLIDGKDKNLATNAHLFGGLQHEHDIINIEDGIKGLTFDTFYNKVTGDIEVNPKNKQGYTIPYKDASKFVGTFNYGISKNRGSDLRRLFFVSFGDYYHAHTDNFKNERKVSDDFGYSFFQDWSNEQYNKFYNFLMQCCQLYLANRTNEFKAPMDNIIKNNLKAQIGDNCMEWAQDYFSDETNFNCNLIKKDLYKSYVDTVGKKSALGVSRFKKSLHRYCQLYGYIFNPKRLCNSQGVIKVNSYKEGTQIRTTKECFYIENTEELNVEATEIIPTPKNINTDDLKY